MSDKIVVPMSDPDYTGDGGGLYGFITWRMLEEYLQQVGETKPAERIAGIHATHSGIHFSIEKE